MKFSSYTSAFNLIKMGFDWQSSLLNYSQFMDEVVIAINTSSDNTFEILNKFIEDQNLTNIILCQSSFDYNDPAFDGKIKDFALQRTSGDIKISCDIDERFPLYQKNLWNRVARYLLSNEKVSAFLIPSINLCGDIYHYKDIGYKWYMHKDGYFRGVVNFAKKENGKIDTDKSDTCELIDSYGNLVPTLKFSNDIEDLRSGSIPYVFHYWAVDKRQRQKQNEFWQPVWSNRKGEQVDTKIDFSNININKHKLPIND
jgi:hypothetical protein